MCYFYHISCTDYYIIFFNLPPHLCNGQAHAKNSHNQQYINEEESEDDLVAKVSQVLLDLLLLLLVGVQGPQVQLDEVLPELLFYLDMRMVR